MVKRFTLMISAALLVAGAAIAAPQAPKAPKAANLNDVKAKIEAKQNSKKVFKSPLSSPTRVSLPLGDVLYEVEGVSKLYSKDVAGFDYGYDYEDNELASTIVFGDNNEVYIQDILSYWGFQSYIKGENVNGTVTFPVGQTVASYGYYGFNVYVLKYSGQDEYDYPIYEVDSSISSFSYTYNAEDGTLELDVPEDHIVGYVYAGVDPIMTQYYGISDGDWVGDGDYTQIYTPFSGTITSIPEGLDVTPYIFNDENYGHSVNVAYDEDYLYIQGLSIYLPDAVVIAYLDGNEAYIPQDLIVGAYYYFWTTTKVLIEDEEYYYILAPETKDYKLTVDLENNLITSNDPDFLLAFNLSSTEAYPMEVYSDFKISLQDSFSGVPKNPFGLSFDNEYFDYYGYSSFYFSIPNISTEGTVLDPTYLSYKIYYDNEVLEFEYDDDYYIYPDIEGTVTEIPFFFTNGYDIYLNSSIIERGVDLYFEGFDALGVQSVYRYDGTVTESDIVYLNIETGEITEEPAGITAVSTAPVVSEVYYDLNGRKVVNPSNGIFVKKATLADGQVVTTKVIKR